ncbi:uncharacterized protein LOC123515114 isoform X1 [Portunus trituberculatus]|uniref:uncharacterized protein LOC123515114 isoform X1 n=1 Tax=Portunus trituberculatus TaxID=210409 RepID=UPI001E1D167B|nr:uncharacterized protein LOC123515114 isoform X1 [Portunus trituberculatus]
MNVCVKLSLRNACVAAALYVAVVQMRSFLSAGLDDRPSQRGAAPLHDASCRALFTVTDVPHRYAPNASLFVHNRYGYVAANNLSVDCRARHYPDTCGGKDVAGAIQQLLLKRDSPSGAATTDYSPLAAVLPSVLAFQEEGEASSPTVTATTRIGAAGGLLPYVPCEIATYADPASVAACFRARLAHQDTLWIFFMGDSKIRNLFYEFLYRSEEELQYHIKFQKGSAPFTTLDRKHMKLDMEAVSAKLPGMRISLEFRTFSNLAYPRTSVEVVQLARWAAGQETPPHLLVVGYECWTILKSDAREFHDVLGNLMDMHEVVVPLLYQLSQKTRVVVTSQNRYKQYAAQDEQVVRRGYFADNIHEWSETVFLHYLRRLSFRHPQPPTSDTTSDALTEPPARVTIAPARNSQSRDHLIPTVEDSGVWWWDTSLPVSLAENAECEQLYFRGLRRHPMYKSLFHRCMDDNHAGIVTLADQVTMLLNLVCNSMLGAREGVCCG